MGSADSSRSADPLSRLDPWLGWALGPTKPPGQDLYPHPPLQPLSVGPVVFVGPVCLSKQVQVIAPIMHGRLFMTSSRCRKEKGLSCWTRPTS